MERDEKVLNSIKRRDVDILIDLFFDQKTLTINDGFKTENEVWDYKADCPGVGASNVAAWAEIAKDVLAFCNNRGGVMFFGIRNLDFAFCGAGTVLDSKLVNDQLRKFLGDRIWVEYHRTLIQQDQTYLGVALIQPRRFSIECFIDDAPLVNGKRLFSAGDTAFREGDSTKIVKSHEINSLAQRLGGHVVGRIYAHDIPFYRILSPDYIQFVERKIACKKVEMALSDPRTAITSIAGIGGIGKTALATWAVIRAYEKGLFKFIVSITAKDRELTTSGIQGLTPALNGFDSLLNSILEVLGFESAKDLPLDKKETEVRTLLENSGGLIYVDNLETVDDSKIITFLDTLPIGVKGIVTTRRSAVRVSVHPVEPGPMTAKESSEFILTLGVLPGLDFVKSLSQPECERIGTACDNTPLAIRWIISRSKSAAESLATAEGILITGRRGDELLEFCFRRVYEKMSGAEKDVLKTLALFQSPLPLEAVMVGSGLHNEVALDSLEQFEEDGLVQRVYDNDRKAYSYRIIPMGRSFISKDVRKSPELEASTRKRLSDWFEAKDVADSNERLVVREIRNGRSATENGLIDLAYAAEKRGDLNTASRLYIDALARNPNSWKAARRLAEFYRHKDNNITKALQLYEQAASFAPHKGPDRALIYREWAMLLRGSGEINATKKAIEKFDVALKETPNDPVILCALSQMLAREGAFKRVIVLMEPCMSHDDTKTREIAKSLLREAYEKTDEFVKLAELKSRR